MPMSEVDYDPIPVIPAVIYYTSKIFFSVEEALKSTLHQTTKVRSNQDGTDVVCLRLRSYMLNHDPIFLADDQVVEKRLDALRTELQTAKMARDSRRLQLLVEGDNSAMHGDLHAALGVIDADDRSVHELQQHSVMNWCRDRGWLRKEDNEWRLLAMIQRGLVIDSDGTFLTCAHHRKQMHGFDECLKHVSEYKQYYHWKDSLYEAEF